MDWRASGDFLKELARQTNAPEKSPKEGYYKGFTLNDATYTSLGKAKQAEKFYEESYYTRIKKEGGKYYLYTKPKF